MPTSDFLEFIIVYGVCIVPIYAWFTLRRELQPIRGRVPELSLLACIFHAFSMLILTLRTPNLEKWPCWTESLVYLGPIFITSCLIVRAAYLVLTVQMTKAFSQKPQSKESSPNLPWIWTRRWILKPNVLASFAAALSAIMFLPILVWRVSSSQTDSKVCIPCQGSQCLVPAILLFASAFVIGTTLLLIRNVKESLFIRSELAGAVILSILFGVLHIVAESGENDNMHLTDKYLSLFLVHGLLLAYPLRKSFRMNRIGLGFGFGKGITPKASSTIPTSPVGPAFQKVVNSSAGFEAFKTFLIKELSIENLIGWKAVKDLRLLLKDQEAAISDSPVLSAKIQYVLETHIIIGSPGEVNIGYTSKAQAMKILESLPGFGKKATRTPKTISRSPRAEVVSKDSRTPRGISDLVVFLSKVETEIVDLLRNDSFSRFVRTEEYKKAWVAILAEENQFDLNRLDASKPDEKDAQEVANPAGAEKRVQAEDVPIGDIPIIF